MTPTSDHPTGIEILPLAGLASLKFGATRKELGDLLGDPNGVDRYADEDDFAAETWHYDDLEMSFVVEEVEDWKLTTITVSADHFSVAGANPIGWEKDQLLEWLKDADLGEFNLENWSDEEVEDFLLVSIAAKNLNFWLVGGVVTEIQWGVGYDNNDAVMWP